MGLHITHFRRRDAGVFQSGTNDGLLRKAVRGGDPVASPILVHGGTSDDRKDPVTVFHRLRKFF